MRIRAQASLSATLTVTIENPTSAPFTAGGSTTGRTTRAFPDGTRDRLRPASRSAAVERLVPGGGVALGGTRTTSYKVFPDGTPVSSPNNSRDRLRPASKKESGSPTVEKLIPGGGVALGGTRTTSSRVFPNGTPVASPSPVPPTPKAVIEAAGSEERPVLQQTTEERPTLLQTTEESQSIEPRPKRNRRDTEKMGSFKETLAKRPKIGEKKEKGTPVTKPKTGEKKKQERPKRIRRVTERMAQYKEAQQPTQSTKTTVNEKTPKKKKNPTMHPGFPSGGGHGSVQPGEPVPLQVHEVIIGPEGGGCSFTFADLDGNKVDNGRAHTLAELDFERDYQETVVDHCTDHRISFTPKIINAHKWLKVD